MLGLVVGLATGLSGPLGQPASASPSPSSYDPGADPYSMAAVTAQTGATMWWDAGYTGAGVDVALIDTGVTPVSGLSTAGKIVHGPDLSFDSQDRKLTRRDNYGHGTFMAGLIAGRDSGLSAPYSSAPASAYRGMAPDARILSVKVGSADGGTDVSQVIAAVYWVIQHKNDNGMNIRVLNLSYGTNSLQPYLIDPLSYAVEKAWEAGIVVVAAAGNSGYQKGNNAQGLANPAYNPFVIGVGGIDTMGTVQMADDIVADFSAASGSCSSGCKKPDLVAPGSRTQGLRVPDSYVDARHPGGRIDSRYFRGSGTSQAAAITSGAVALILQKYPKLTPDQVKRFITSNATKLAVADSQAQGDGQLNLKALATATPGGALQRFAPSTGTGLLEGSRGQDHLTSNGVVLTGERDIFGKPFVSATMAAAAASPSGTWSGGIWNGSTWSGSTWSGSTWSGSTWSGSTWSGSTWSGSTWSGSTWSTGRWS